MRNKRIIQAYDSINPNPAQKQKMLDAILAEARLEDTPRKQKRKKEPVVYTAKPTKESKRSTFMSIAASLIMLLIAGFVLVHMVRQPENVSYREPVNLGTPYDTVLTKYKIALEEGWSAQQCQIEDICGHVTTSNYSALDVSYAMEDLDGNGRVELIITNGQGLVWDLYTLLEDETPVHVHCQEEGWPVYRLYENGVICAEDFDSGKVYEYYVYRDGAFTGPEMILRQTSGMFTYESTGEEQQVITEAEAEAKMARYKLQELDEISLLTLVSEEVAEKYLYGRNTKYAEIIAKYNQAIAEGWSKERCANEGISLRMQAGNDVSKAGYAFLDLDGDGREELLIAEESLPHIDNIWDLYTTLEDGTPVQLWVDERDGYQGYLYEGNVIGIEYSGKDRGEYIYHTIQNGQLSLKECLMYSGENWAYTTGGEQLTMISPKEAADITYGYEHKKLDLTWLADLPDSLRDTEAVEWYTPVLEKYRTALAEGWDRTMCVENGLSMLTPISSEYESLYYALHDLNEDGVKELIISEYPYREKTDTNFTDIYTRENGEVQNVMSLGDTDMRFLCEGGIVKDLTPPERGDYNAYVSFWELNQDGMFAQTGAVYEIDGQWYHGFRASEKITAAEAEAELMGMKPMYLDFIEIQSSGDGEYQSGYEAFDHIIQKYVTAINEGWTEAQCEQNDISPQIFEGLAGHQNLGWCLVDIDSNGVEELVISDGVYLYDLYVMMPHDGSPGHVLCANGGETWQLCENNVLQMHGLYSGTSVWRNYTLREMDLVQQDMVFYEGAINQYSYGTWDNDLQPISKDEAGNIIGSHGTKKLDLTPFVEAPAFWPDEAEYYEPLLNIYRQAVRENWNPGQCAEKGIGMMVGYYGKQYDELGYALMDLDSDGIEELIITDGLNIYDLYTIIQDEETGPLRLIDAMERIEYFLLDDGRIYCMSSGSASVSYYTFYQLEGRELRLLEGYMMDYETSPDAPWYYFNGVERGAPCPRENAVAAIDPVVFAHIPFTSFE